ncbi:MAG: anthranilate phosphoribosyltransferase [Thermonemataceae bacterium]|nr:anthranilate phosphoribosyltransferase [Thermonemataceae bacterium]
MKEILEYLFQHKTLSQTEAKQTLMEIAHGEHNHYQVAAFLTAFLMRNITLEELKGFQEGLLELCLPVDLSDYQAIDVCGTGGDGKNTFNISTISSFVLAGAGIPVAKHGNYGVSSVAGSSSVLEFLGLQFTQKEDLLKKQLEEAHICFLHAPLFHSAMRFVAPIRKELGVKTFFNMLGPLVNPAQPSVQMVGVFSTELARMYQYIFQERKNMRYSIIHSLDGFDEISLTNEVKIYSQENEQNIDFQKYGLKKILPESIHGGDSIAEAAQIFLEVITGKGSEAQNQVVLANSAVAIQTYYPQKNFSEAFGMAEDSLFGLKAQDTFYTLKSIQ